MNCARQVKIGRDKLHCLQVARQTSCILWLISNTACKIAQQVLRFNVPCLVKLISQDSHLVFSINHVANNKSVTTFLLFRTFMIQKQQIIEIHFFLSKHIFLYQQYFNK